MTEAMQSGELVPPNIRRIHDESGLSVEQIESLRQTLLERRRSLAHEHEQHLDVRFPPDDTVSEAEEEAARTSQQETFLGLAESERALLQMVDRALRKIDNGTYGVSEESGEPISYERLRAVPWARLTASEQEQLERRARGR